MLRVRNKKHLNSARLWRAWALAAVWVWAAALVVSACGEDASRGGAAAPEPVTCDDGSPPPCEPARWTPDNATQAPNTCDDITSLAIFQRRIAPLLDEERPSSCNACHLQGTDLSLFVRGSTPCEAMGCLIEKELVDLDAPESSTILTWIARGGESAALPEEAVAAEYEGFLQWIEYAAQCHGEVCADTAPMCPSDGPVDPPDAGADADVDDAQTPDADASTGDDAEDAAPDDVTLDDATPDDVVEDDAGAEDADDAGAEDAAPDATGDDAGDPSDAEDDATDADATDADAEADVYVSVVEGSCEGDGPAEALLHHVIEPWAGRCEHCHEQDALITIGNPPEWLHGEETVEGALWTLGRFEELELLDLDTPEASLLLLKPLAEDLGGVRHGGGAKFLGLNDQAYLDFLAWIRFYADCQAATTEEGDP